MISLSVLLLCVASILHDSHGHANHSELEEKIHPFDKNSSALYKRIPRGAGSSIATKFQTNYDATSGQITMIQKGASGLTDIAAGIKEKDPLKALGGVADIATVAGMAFPPLALAAQVFKGILSLIGVFTKQRSEELQLLDKIDEKITKIDEKLDRLQGFVKERFDKVLSGQGEILKEIQQEADRMIHDSHAQPATESFNNVKMVVDELALRQAGLMAAFAKNESIDPNDLDTFRSRCKQGPPGAPHMLLQDLQAKLSEGILTSPTPKDFAFVAKWDRWIWKASAYQILLYSNALAELQLYCVASMSNPPFVNVDSVSNDTSELVLAYKAVEDITAAVIAVDEFIRLHWHNQAESVLTSTTRHLVSTNAASPSQIADATYHEFASTYASIGVDFFVGVFKGNHASDIFYWPNQRIAFNSHLRGAQTEYISEFNTTVTVHWVPEIRPNRGYKPCNSDHCATDSLMDKCNYTSMDTCSDKSEAIPCDINSPCDGTSPFQMRVRLSDGDTTRHGPAFKTFMDYEKLGSRAWLAKEEVLSASAKEWMSCWKQGMPLGKLHILNYNDAKAICPLMCEYEQSGTRWNPQTYAEQPKKYLAEDHKCDGENTAEKICKCSLAENLASQVNTGITADDDIDICSRFSRPCPEVSGCEPVCRKYGMQYRSYKSWSVPLALYPSTYRYEYASCSPARQQMVKDCYLSEAACRCSKATMEELTMLSIPGIVACSPSNMTGLCLFLPSNSSNAVNTTEIKLNL